MFWADVVVVTRFGRAAGPRPAREVTTRPSSGRSFDDFELNSSFDLHPNKKPQGEESLGVRFVCYKVARIPYGCWQPSDSNRSRARLLVIIDLPELYRSRQPLNLKLTSV